MNLLKWLAATAGAAFASAVNRPVGHSATPSRHSRRRTINNSKNGLPSGYPGAKLARKAAMHQLAVFHPRGLRQDGKV